MSWLRVLLVLIAFASPLQVAASIGQVVSVEPGAELVRLGDVQPVRPGMEVLSGDTISTDGDGLVQLIFVDQTKIAIGPNARMMLDVTMLRGNRKAKNFAVQALGGSFRFISGKSSKRAYSISTPTSTMAVRGTIFDLWVPSDRQSAMLVLQGTVRMCGLRGGCRASGRQCSLFATSQSGRIGRPIDQEAYQAAIANGFPFVESQAQLVAPLQVDVEGCAGERVAVRPAKPDAPERQAARANTRSSEAPNPNADPPGSNAPQGPVQPDPGAP